MVSTNFSPVLPTAVSGIRNNVSNAGSISTAGNATSIAGNAANAGTAASIPVSQNSNSMEMVKMVVQLLSMLLSSMGGQSASVAGTAGTATPSLASAGSTAPVATGGTAGTVTPPLANAGTAGTSTLPPVANAGTAGNTVPTSQPAVKAGNAGTAGNAGNAQPVRTAGNPGTPGTATFGNAGSTSPATVVDNYTIGGYSYSQPRSYSPPTYSPPQTYAPPTYNQPPQVYNPPTPQIYIPPTVTPKFWGDPHFVGLFDGVTEDAKTGDLNGNGKTGDKVSQKYDFQGIDGQTYNVLSDSGLQVNGTVSKYGDGKNGATVFKEVGITVRGNNGNYTIKDNADAKEAPTVIGPDGKAIALAGGKAVDLGGAGTVQYNEQSKRLDIKTTEYNLGLTKTVDANGNHLNMDAGLAKGFDGRNMDGVLGISGRTDIIKTVQDGKGQQGEGVATKSADGKTGADRKETDYRVQGGVLGAPTKFNNFNT